MASDNQGAGGGRQPIRHQDNSLFTYLVLNGSNSSSLLNARPLKPSDSAKALGLTMPAMSPSEMGFGQSSTPKGDGPTMSFRRSSSADSISNASEFNGSESQFGDGEFDTEEEKRRKRLERNRISARDSRRRKKQYLELLEEKVAQLTEDLDVARAERFEAADATIQSLKTDLVTSLYEKLFVYPPNSALPPDLEAELVDGAQLMKDRYGPHSKERHAVLNYYLTHLDGLLLSPYTRFLLWMSTQDESFYVKSSTTASKKSTDGGKDPKKDNLWASLSTELGLTQEQEEKIKSHYRASDAPAAKLERRKIAHSLTYLSQFQKSLEEQGQAIQSQAHAVQSILTPEQLIRYEKWTSQHREKALDCDQNLSTWQSVDSPPVDQTLLDLLNKPDDDLTADDVSALLDALAKPMAT
ncbi:unnamed protein product [Aphanomyces euteiches]|uniref:BZIP domain-containing protein n=1 Tax=Aphanomyces euteiches TaxID=100861 RepID=A0A6G0XML1_9STRA|nr:hypothetical protein Ae201684_003369 [Aphanomyces euteiches]